MGRIVSVVSGKGGVGKSTVAAGLARSLCSLGRRVLLVDTDWGLCSVQFLLPQGQETVYNTADVLNRRVDVRQAIVSREGSPDFLAAFPYQPTADEEEQLARLLVTLAKEYDYVLVDRPAGLELTLERFLPDYTALLVCGIDSMSVHGAALAREALQVLGDPPCYLVLNRFVPKMVKRRLAHNLDELCDRVGAPLLGIVPEDHRVAEDLATGDFRKNAPYDKAIDRITRRLTGENLPLPKLSKLIK